MALNSENFKNITEQRLVEVVYLYEGGKYDLAKYISGYILEAALKAKICKTLNIDYPEKGDISKIFLTHEYPDLLKLSGLEKEHKERCNADTAFKVNWSKLNEWKVSLRYAPAAVTKEDIEEILTALNDDPNGILTWIKTKW